MTPTRRARARPAAQAGFTFIELLIALVIMATLLMIGVKVNQYLLPENELDSTARTVATAIEDARAEAVVRGRRVFVDFALGNRADAPQLYRSILEPLPGHEGDADKDEFWLTLRDWTTFPPSIRVDSVVVGETDPLTTGVVRLVIQSDGTMQSGLIRIWSPEIDDRKERKFGWATVEVSGLLGEARVLNQYKEPDFLRADGFQ